MSETTAKFPAPWIVLPPVALFLADSLVHFADRAGVVMDVDNTSTAGHLVLGAFLVTLVASLLVEAGAIALGLRAMVRSPRLRSGANVLCVCFGGIASVAYVVSMGYR
jgi:hypothetical protein